MKKVLVITTWIILPIVGLSQTDKELVEQSIHQGLIRSHIGFLASDELEGRDTPSRGLKVASKYMESRFVEYGIQKAPGMDSYFQTVPMKKLAPPTEGILSIGADTFTIQKDFIFLKGESKTIATDYVFVGQGVGADWDGVDIKGKTVIAICGDGVSDSPQEWFRQSAEKRKKIKELGGLLLVELYNSSQLPWSLLVRYLSGEKVVLDEGGDEVAHVWMNRSAKSLDLDSGKTKLSVPEATAQRFNSQNVVGFIEGTDPKLKKEVIVYSAHYDHIGIGQADANGDSIYNGSRDNAVGAVTVLAAAQNLGRNPPKRSSLFVLFTGEEKGLLGSKYFVDHSPVALEEIVYCFNSDNGGYNDTSKATIIGLTRTTAEEKIVEACQAFGLKAIEDPAPEQGLFDRSDNVNFAAKGIPAPTFSMGFNAFDKEITKYYHQAGDGPETLDYAYLEKFFKSYVYACRLIANTKKTPFWVKGDTYYEGGKTLYK